MNCLRLAKCTPTAVDWFPNSLGQAAAGLIIRLQCNYSFVKIFVLMHNLKETWNGKMSTWLDRFVRPGVC
ncbi:unnamed protein product [Urochloa humidicola]